MKCNQQQTSVQAMKACALLVAAAVVFATALPAQATLVIGDFEGAGPEPGWGDRASPNVLLPSIPYASSDSTTTYDHSPLFATSGSQSIIIGALDGFDFNLYYDAAAAGAPANFADVLAHDTLEFDITFPANTEQGFSQINQVVFNSTNTDFTTGMVVAPGGFSGPSGPSSGWGLGGGAANSRSLTFDYSGVPFGALGSITYLEILIATNNDGLAGHTTYYIDNVRLTSSVPEPSSLLMLALAGLLGSSCTLIRKLRA